MAKEIRNIGASVRARLLQLAKAGGQSFDLVLNRFASSGCSSGSASHDLPPGSCCRKLLETNPASIDVDTPKPIWYS